MSRIVSTIILLFFLITDVCAQSVPATDTTVIGRYRISLITCGPGEEIWETFGHACIRVIDSTRVDAERDKIYNYGFFEASEDNPLLKQVFTGWLVDFVDTITYDELMIEYRAKRRSLNEQVFLLTDQQKEEVVKFLRNNLKKENRYYNFDTFYDNCSTRIRDLFVLLFGKRLVFGPVLEKDCRLTFRQATINRMCVEQEKYWFRFALNLTYASRSDRVMSDGDAMFLPTYLAKGFGGATLDGKPLCGAITPIQAETIVWTDTSDRPIKYLFLVAAVVVIVTTIKPRSVWAYILRYSYVIFTGLIGIGMVYLMVLNGEPAWKDNWNVLWALPLNVVFPFLNSRLKGWYGIVAIVLIAISFILHFAGVQYLALPELIPVIFTLLFVFAISWRQVRNAK